MTGFLLFIVRISTISCRLESLPNTAHFSYPDGSIGVSGCMITISRVNAFRFSAPSERGEVVFT